MNEITAKILLIGHEGVGKTSLVKRFVFSLFSDEYMTTIGVNISKKTVELGGAKVNLMIWDVAGDMLYSKSYKRYLSGAAGVLWVHDLSRPETHSMVVEERQLMEETQKGIQSIVVGNKSDLVQTSEVEMSNDLLTSAKENNQVDLAFEMIAEKIISNT